MATYQIWYADYYGTRICPIWDVSELNFTRVLGDVGTLTLTCPWNSNWKKQPYQDPWTDYQILVYRTPKGEVPSFEFAGFIRGREVELSGPSQQMFTLKAVDANHLLKRRIVAYEPETTKALATGYADDAMKLLVERNLYNNEDYSGTGLDPDRSIDQHNFSVEASVSQGPTVNTQDFSWENLLKALQELQALSRTLGDEVFFWVDTVQPGRYVFRTSIGQPGVDRTSATPHPALFSIQMGNLTRAKLSYDAEDEANYLYLGGSGISDNQEVGTAYDYDRITLSPFGRMEAYMSNPLESESTGVSDSADLELTRRRPVNEFQGELLSHPLISYGGVSGWKLGDRVSIDFGGTYKDAVIRGVDIKYSSESDETITGRIEIYNE